MEKQEKPLKEPGKLRQFLVTVIANLSALTYGIIIGWQSPSAPQLQSPSPPIGSEPMTDDEVSWINGITCLSGTIVIALLSVIPDRFSRKRLGCALALPLIVGWLLIILATEHVHIYISRALSGIGGALIFFVIPNYVSEIACDSIRGFLASVLVFFLNLGILLAFILGGMISLRDFAIVSLTIPVLYIVAFAFMPESPVYLVRQNRIHEAARALRWLSAGDNLVAERTLSRIQLQVREITSAKTVKLSDLFRDRATIMGLIIVLGLYSGQQLCGVFAMISYSETIFKISGSSLSPNTSAIIVAAIQLLGTVVSLFLVERAGRRPLILISCAGMCTCHSVIGAFCYFQNLGYEISAFSWIPVVALSTYMLLYSLGMGGGPVVIMSEIFSRDVTSLGITVGQMISWIGAFVMGKIFADLIALLGMDGCFFLLATFCACTFLFCFVLLPETKGRLREDIVNELNNARCAKTKNKQNIEHIIGTDSVHAVHV